MTEADFRRMSSVRYKKLRLTETDLDLINRKYVILTRKKATKKYIYWKMVRELFFDCPNESETQTGIVLSTRQRKRNRHDARACQSATWERNSGTLILFFLIQVWKFLIQFYYRYDWTVTDTISREHRISNSSKFGKDHPFWVKVRVKQIWKAR